MSLFLLLTTFGYVKPSYANERPIETSVYSNGAIIKVYFDAELGQLIGKDQNEVTYTDTEVRGLKAYNEATSKSYEVTTEVTPSNCEGCLATISDRYENGARVYTSRSENGQITKETFFGSGRLEGFPLQTYENGKSVLYSYKLNSTELTELKTTHESDNPGLKRTTHYIADPIRGWIPKNENTTEHSSPLETSSLESIQQNNSSFSNMMGTGCDARGCWVTARRNCPRGWSCSAPPPYVGSTEAFVMPPMTVATYPDDDEGEGKEFIGDQVEPEGCTVQRTSGAFGAGGIWIVYGDNTNPATLAIHFDNYSTLPFQINSTRLRVTMGSGSFGVTSEDVVETYFDRTLYFDAPVGDTANNGAHFISIRATQTNVQYPVHNVIVKRESCP